MRFFLNTLRSCFQAVKAVAKAVVRKLVNPPIWTTKWVVKTAKFVSVIGLIIGSLKYFAWAIMV